MLTLPRQINPAIKPQYENTGQKIFKADFIDLMSGAKQGNLGIWRYDSDPAHIKADGAKLWAQLVENATTYYVSRLGDQSLADNINAITNYVGANVDQVIDLGPGTVRPEKANLLGQLIAKGTYIPVDISAEFLLESFDLQKNGVVGRVRPVVADFNNDDFNLPPAQKRLFLFMGATIGNIPGGEKTNPSEYILRLLTHFKKQMAEGDIIAIGYDSCMDKEAVLNCYNDPLAIEFMISPLYRALYELNPIGNYNPNLFSPEFIWHGEMGQCAHTVVAQETQKFAIDNQIYFIERGQRLILSSSYKFSDNSMVNYFENAGFSDIQIVGQANKPMKLVLALKMPS